MKNKVHNYSSFSLFQQQKHCSSLFLIKDQPLLDLFFLKYSLKFFLIFFLNAMRVSVFCITLQIYMYSPSHYAFIHNSAIIVVSIKLRGRIFKNRGENL